VPKRRLWHTRGPAGGRVGGVVAVHVLADETGRVAVVREPRGDRIVLLATSLEVLHPAVRGTVPLDARVVRVLSAKDRRPRRTTKRLADVGVRQRRAHVPYPFSDLGHRRHRVFGLVVGHDEQYVGPRGRLGLRLAHRIDGADVGTQQEHPRSQNGRGQHRADLPHSLEPFLMCGRGARLSRPLLYHYAL
jgi:hypothetical protein